MALQSTVKICSTYRTKVESCKKKVFERGCVCGHIRFDSASAGAPAQILLPMLHAKQRLQGSSGVK
jgi:hypothetical protein